MDDGNVAVLDHSALRAVLQQLKTAEVPHTKRSLYDHLCGVDEILQAWGQADELCTAGLFHSIYSTEAFRYVTIPLDERFRLRALIGESAERLVYLFATVPRTALFAASSAAERVLPKQSGTPSRSNGECTEVSQEERAQLLLLHMANRLEQTSKPGDDIGTWLAWMGERAADLEDAGRPLPDVLAALRGITASDERHVQKVYRCGLSQVMNDPRAALRAFETLSDTCGVLGEPHIMQGVAHLLLGDPQSARASAARGQLLLSCWGSPWHKRFSMGEWCALAGLIVDGHSAQGLSTVLLLLSTPNGAPNSGSAEPIRTASPRFLSYLNTIQVQRSKRAFKWYPELRRQSWYDPFDFPVARELEQRFADIKAEAAAIGSEFYHEEAENIDRTGSWKVCMFYEQGRRNDMLAARCPVTAQILDGDDSIRRSAGLTYLSRVGAHTHVAAHRAHSNIRLRCHLALSVPRGDCAIRVGETTRRWEEGKCIVFDDTFEHEIWNRTDEERLILLVDLWHPDLTAIERESLDAINLLADYKAEVMLKTWRRNDAQRERERQIAQLGR